MTNERDIQDMTEEELAMLFEELGAIQKGHFIYASGRHGEVYVQKGAITKHPLVTEELCIRLVRRIQYLDIEVVVVTATGAIGIGHALAQALSMLYGYEVCYVYIDKIVKPSGKVYELGRGFAADVEGKRCLYGEDIVTTGGTIKKGIELVRENGGEVIAVVDLWNRGGVTADDLDVPVFESLVDIQFDSYSPDNCPPCAAGEALIDPNTMQPIT